MKKQSLTYQTWNKTKSKNWKNAPISPTCELLSNGKFCDLPTDAAYPAMGRGWMALCFKHAMKHRPHIFNADELILEGETWKNSLPSTAKMK